jgi:hypothetical protein
MQETYDRVLFVERSGELPVLARLSPTGTEPEGNRVLTRRKSVQADPKPGDLSMSRLKSA